MHLVHHIARTFAPFALFCRHGGDFVCQYSKPLHSRRNLLNVSLLLTRGRIDLLDQVGRLGHGIYDIVERLPARSGKFSSFLHPFSRILDQPRDFLRRFSGAFCQLSHFFGNDGKPSAVFTGAGRFDCCIQCEEVGLIGDVRDHLDDFCNLFRAFGDALHTECHLLDRFSSLDGGLVGEFGLPCSLRCLRCHLADGRGHLLGGAGGLFRRLRLLRRSSRNLEGRFTHKVHDVPGFLDQGRLCLGCPGDFLYA